MSPSVKASLTNLVATNDGQMFLEWLLSEHYNVTTKCTDLAGMSRFEGKRELIHQILRGIG